MWTPAPILGPVAIMTQYLETRREAVTPDLTVHLVPGQPSAVLGTTAFNMVEGQENQIGFSATGAFPAIGVDYLQAEVFAFSCAVPSISSPDFLLVCLSVYSGFCIGTGNAGSPPLKKRSSLPTDCAGAIKSRPPFDDVGVPVVAPSGVVLDAVTASFQGSMTARNGTLFLGFWAVADKRTSVLSPPVIVLTAPAPRQNGPGATVNPTCRGWYADIRH